MPLLADAVPSYVESVTIYAHDDGGRTYALRLHDVLAARGLEVRVDGLG